MEQEGICYFFKHEKSKHTLMLVDSPSAHSSFGGYVRIAYRPEALATPNSEFILDWVAGKELESGGYAHTDFNFETPSESLLTQSKISRKRNCATLEVFDFPGNYEEKADGGRHAKV